VTVSAFLAALAVKFETAPASDAKLARDCRDYATIALHLEAEYEAARQ
jgi:hypothetical protein